MKWISDLLDLIFPRHCLVCGNILSPEEHDLCLNCRMQMPRIEERRLEEMQKIFYGIVPIEKVAAYIYYRKGSPYNKLMHQLKYNNRPETGERIASEAATALTKSGIFDGIDIIVPLPLSKKKMRKRGYNQSYHIAKGISQVTGIPIVTDCVIRTISNETQTHKHREERWKNTEGIFSIKNHEKLHDKHILLIDDVLTTGATIASCAKAILECGCKVSIFTIAYSSNDI